MELAMHLSSEKIKMIITYLKIIISMKSSHQDVPDNILPLNVIKGQFTIILKITELKWIIVDIVTFCDVVRF